MRKGIIIEVKLPDQARLQSIIRDRDSAKLRDSGECRGIDCRQKEACSG
jgi:hypothetical protein